MAKTLNQKREDVSSYLHHKMLELSVQQGRVMDQGHLAIFLGVSQPTLSSWMARGRIPTGKNLALIADKFQELDIYDIVEERVQLPEDSDFRDLYDCWLKMNDEEKKNLAELVEGISRQHRENKDAKVRGETEKT